MDLREIRHQRRASVRTVALKSKMIYTSTSNRPLVLLRFLVGPKGKVLVTLRTCRASLVLGNQVYRKQKRNNRSTMRDSVVRSQSVKCVSLFRNHGNCCKQQPRISLACPRKVPDPACAVGPEGGPVLSLSHSLRPCCSHQKCCTA